MMVGRSIEQLFPKVHADHGAVALELRNVSYGHKVQDISLTLRSGEILGLAGLIGSGRTELALTIFGITPASSGEILVHGKKSPSTGRAPHAIWASPMCRRIAASRAWFGR